MLVPDAETLLVVHDASRKGVWVQNIATRERHRLPDGVTSVQYNADGMASYKQSGGPHVFVQDLFARQIWEGH